MIDNRTSKERVVLAGVEDPSRACSFSSSMEELADLTHTAGGLVLEQVTQKRDKPDSKYLMGSGKVKEIKDWVDSQDVDTVIFNNRLTPRQNLNLEEALGCKVIDRMQLILDIFAMRARSYEGMLQVEQAQLNYLLPRLTGQGIILSRQGGGIGSRGPGESQLEVDRRHIRSRISDIDRQLKKVERSRQVMRKKREASDLFKIGLIGYTNAGKSSILNALGQSAQYEKDELFATLDATTKRVKLRGNFTVNLTDTVGFIQDLPTELIKAFKSTLEEATQVDLLVHVVDASNPDHEMHEATVKDILADLTGGDIPILTIYNKMDLVPEKNPTFIPTEMPSYQLSIKSETGPNILRGILLNKLTEIFHQFALELPYEEAHKLSEIGKIAFIDQVLEKDWGYQVSGLIAPGSVWKLDHLL